MTMIRRPRDEALGFGCRGEHQPWSAVAASVPPMRTKFERIATLAGRLPPAAGDLIGVLIASALPVKDRGCEVLRPLWTEEAMHRADVFMRLVGAMQRRRQSANQNPIVAGVVDFVARDLAARLRELRSGQERAMMPCAMVLRDVVADLGALFGCPANVALTTKIDRVSLAAYKRRALVLAACELVCNALLHAFPGAVAGQIDVGLTSRGPNSACLRVADNGIGFGDVPPDFACGVAAGLADLLEADLAYDRTSGWTIAEIVFPVRRS